MQHPQQVLFILLISMEEQSNTIPKSSNSGSQSSSEAVAAQPSHHTTNPDTLVEEELKPTCKDPSNPQKPLSVQKKESIEQGDILQVAGQEGQQDRRKLFTTQVPNQQQIAYKISDESHPLEYPYKTLQLANRRLQDQNQALEAENILLKIQRHEQKLYLQQLANQCRQQIQVIEHSKAWIQQQVSDFTKMKQGQQAFINQQKGLIQQIQSSLKKTYPYLNSIRDCIQQGQDSVSSFDDLDEDKDFFEIQNIKQFIQFLPEIDAFLKKSKAESTKYRQQIIEKQVMFDIQTRQFKQSGHMKQQKITQLQQQITKAGQDHQAQISNINKAHQIQIKIIINQIQSSIYFQHQQMIADIPAVMQEFIKSCQEQKIKREEHWETKIQQFENTIKTKDEQIRGIINSVKDQCTKYQNQIQTLEDFLQRQGIQNHLQKEQISTIQQEQVNRQENYKVSVRQLQNMLSQLTEQINLKNKQILQTKEEKVNQQKHHQDTLQMLQQKFKKERTDVKQKWEKEQTQLQSNIIELNNTLVLCQQKIDTLTRQCADTKQKKHKLQYEIQSKVKEIKILQRNENEIKQINENKQQQIDRYKSELESLRINYTAQAQTLSKLYQQSIEKQKTAHILQLQTLTEAYKNAIQKEKLTNAKLQANIDQKQKKIQMLESVIIQHKKEIEEKTLHYQDSIQQKTVEYQNSIQEKTIQYQNSIQKKTIEYQKSILDIKEKTNLTFSIQLEQIKTQYQKKQQQFQKSLNQHKKIELSTITNSKTQAQRQYYLQIKSKDQLLRTADQHISQLKDLLSKQTLKIENQINCLKTIEQHLRQSYELQLEQLKLQHQNITKEELEKQSQVHHQILKKRQQDYRQKQRGLEKRHKEQLEEKDNTISDTVFRTNNLIQTSSRQKDDLCAEINAKDTSIGKIISRYEQEQRTMRETHATRENDLLAKFHALTPEFQTAMLKNIESLQLISQKESYIDELTCQLETLRLEITKRDGYIETIRLELDQNSAEIQKLTEEAQQQQMQMRLRSQQTQSACQNQLKELSSIHQQTLAKNSQLCSELIKQSQFEYQQQIAFYSGKCQRLEESLRIHADLFELQTASLQEEVSELLLSNEILQDKFNYFKENKKSEIQALQFEIQDREVKMNTLASDLESAQQRIDQLTQSQNDCLEYLMGIRLQNGSIVAQRLSQTNSQSQLMARLKQMLIAFLHKQSQLSTCNKQLLAKVGNLENNIQAYRNAERELVSTNTTYQGENKVLKENVSLLQTQLQTIKIQSEGIKAMELQLKLKIQRLKLDQDSSNTRLSELQQRQWDLQSHNKELTLVNKAITKQLQEKQDILNSQLFEQIGDNQQLKIQVKQLTTSQQQSFAKITHYQSEIQNLKRLNDDLTTEKENLNMLRESLEEENKSLEENLSQSAKNKQQQIYQIGILKSQNGKLACKIEETKLQIDRMNKAVEDLQRQKKEQRLKCPPYSNGIRSATLLQNTQVRLPQSPINQSKPTNFFSKSSLLDFTQKGKQFLIDKIAALCKRNVVSTELVYKMQNNNGDFCRLFSATDLTDKLYCFIFLGKQKRIFGVTTFRQLYKSKNSAFLFCVDSETVVGKKATHLDRQPPIKCDPGKSLIFANSAIILKNPLKHLEFYESKSQLYFQKFDRSKIFGNSERPEPAQIQIEDFQIHRLDLSR